MLNLRRGKSQLCCLRNVKSAKFLSFTFRTDNEHFYLIAPNALFHPLGGLSDEWYSTKKFHDPKPTPKDRPIGHLPFPSP